MSLYSNLRRPLTVPFAGDEEDRLLSTMKRSIEPPAPKRLPPEIQKQLEAESAAIGAPDWSQGAGLGDKPLPRIHLGVSTKGLQGVERDVARVQVARDFDREGTGFKITPDFVEQIPRDPHTDWKDRLKSAGKTAIISMANIKRSNPDASWQELLAGGATGGAIGAISRDTGDAIFRRAQIEDMEKQLALQMEMQRQQQQGRLIESQINENISQAKRAGQPQKPSFESRVVGKDEYPDIPEGSQIRQEFDPQTGKMKDVLVGGKPVVTRSPRPRSSGTPHASTRIVAAGEYEGIPEGTEIRTLWNGESFEDQLRGGKPIVATTKPFSETGEESPKERQEREAKYEAAKQLLADLGAQEEAARVAKDQAWKDYEAAKKKYPDNPDIQDDVIAARRRVDEAQKHYESFWSKKNEIRAEMRRNQPRLDSSTSNRSLNPTEQRIYDAAKSRGKDPDEAVRRYRAGEY